MKRRRVEKARERAMMFVVRREMADIMRKAELHPSFVYAWEKTGMLVGEETPHTEEQRQEWNDAVEDWYDKHPEQDLEEEDETA